MIEKKYTFDEIKEVDLLKVKVDRLATSKKASDCFEDEDLDKHLSEFEKLANNYRFPCLLKMNSNTGETDYSILRDVSELETYCGEYLDCKNGVDIFWDKSGELLFEVTGQAFADTKEKNWHLVTQDVKLFNMDHLNKTELYKFLEEYV